VSVLFIPLKTDQIWSETESQEDVCYI